METPSPALMLDTTIKNIEAVQNVLSSLVDGKEGNIDNTTSSTSSKSQIHTSPKTETITEEELSPYNRALAGALLETYKQEALREKKRHEHRVASLRRSCRKLEDANAELLTKIQVLYDLACEVGLDLVKLPGEPEILDSLQARD